MDLNFLNRTRELIDLKKLKFDHRVLVFLFFFIISSIFWFLNALNKKYISDIKYPVRYINFPQNKILINNLPKRLVFRVESQGYNLLKNKILPSFRPVVFNVNAYKLTNISSSSNQLSFILTNLAKDRISNQLSSDLRLLEIKPDTLYFEFASLIQKKVHIIPDVELVLEKPFLLKSEITTYPDSIVVSGPNSIIDTINYIKTKYFKIGNIQESITKNIPLQTIKNTTFNRKKVMVSIPIEQFTETQLNIPITVSSQVDTITIQTFPMDIEVTFQVALSDFDKISKDLFEAKVNYYPSINPNIEFLDISMTKFPDFIKSLRYKPNKVEYIIIK